MRILFTMIVSFAVSLTSINLVNAGSIDVLPGVVFFDGTEKLNGKLVFLVEHDYTSMTNSEAAATIYEFDLVQKEIKPITNCPYGQFIPSRDGKTFAVVYLAGDASAGYGSDTNLFVYSEPLRLSRKTNIECSPQDSFIAGGYVLFQLEGYNFPSVGHYLTQSNKPTETKLVVYNITNNQVRIADFPYSHYRNEESEPLSFRSFDGQYIFFRGRNAPIEGTVLVSSPLDSIDAEMNDPKGEKGKILHTFSPIGPFSGRYELMQLSPDRRYALIRLLNPLLHRKYSNEDQGTAKTYYLVDVSTGKTRVLLEDRSEAATKTSVSQIWWVQAELER
jgi:hypothetical protein